MERRHSGIEAQRAALRNLSSVLINRYITAAEVEVDNGKCNLVIESNPSG
jgi:hypothetical protein